MPETNNILYLIAALGIAYVLTLFMVLIPIVLVVIAYKM